MPPAEVEVSADLVFRLLTTQRPQLAGLDVESLAHGWDNVSFRVGEELVARLPRRQLAVELLANEARWLPDLARRLPLPIPAPVFMGRAEHGYPWPWALVPWIPGLSAAVSTGLDLTICASSLWGFLAALHAKAPADAPVYPYRGVPLNTRDDVTRERIALLEATTDRRVALASWDHALGAQQFEDEARWLHGDLHPHNLLTVDGGLSGVADFGDITSGDPATDLAIA
jgi:aminoglycoside phosphotransferase (APT) family kinase protein